MADESSLLPSLMVLSSAVNQITTAAKTGSQSGMGATSSALGDAVEPVLLELLELLLRSALFDRIDPKAKVTQCPLSLRQCIRHVPLTASGGGSVLSAGDRGNGRGSYGGRGTAFHSESPLLCG